MKDIACCTGQTARFECIVQSDPYETSVTWAKDNVQLETDHKKMIEFRNGVCRLTVLNINPSMEIKLSKKRKYYKTNNNISR